MSNLLKLYIKKLLSEAGDQRTRKRESGSLRGLIDGQHDPVVVTILDDKAADFNEDITKFPTMKSFICFANPGFESNVIRSLEKKWKESYKDRNDPHSIFSAYEESKVSEIDDETKKSFDIGLNKPVKIVYVMFTDITGIGVKALGDQDDEGNPTRRKSQFDEYQKTDDYGEFDDRKTYLRQKSKLDRRFRHSKENYGSSYMRASGITQQQLTLALQDLGLVRVVKDIPNVYNEDYIENSFASIFNDNNWTESLKQMGYSRGKTAGEIKKLAKVYNMDKDSVAAAPDEVLMGSSALNSKNDLVDTIENGFAASAEKFIPSIFELYGIFRIDPDSVSWTFKVWLESWDEAGQSQGSESILKILDDAINSSSSEETYKTKSGKEKTRIVYDIGEVDESLQEIAKVKLLKMFADRYIGWLGNQHDYVKRKEAEAKLDPNDKKSYDKERIKLAKSDFSSFFPNLKKDNSVISTDSAGFPTNLTDQQKALFYSTINQDFRFKIATLPFAKTKDNPMSYAPAPDGLSPAEARVWQSTQNAITAKHNTDLANKRRAKEGLPALPQSSVVTRVTNPMDRARKARAAAKARSKKNN